MSRWVFKNAQFHERSAGPTSPYFNVFLLKRFLTANVIIKVTEGHWR